MRILVVDAGSSSLKLSLTETETEAPDPVPLAEHIVQRWDGEEHLEPLEEFLSGAVAPDAVGHRVVHGGPRHLGPAALTAPVIDYRLPPRRCL